MNLEALEGLRQQYAAMRWGQIIYAEDLCHVLDALLSEASPVAMHWPDGTVVQATGSGAIAELQSGGAPRMKPSVYDEAWQNLDTRRIVMRGLILERYCVPLENWSA